MQRQHPCPAGSELDRQRQPVHALADPSDDLLVRASDVAIATCGARSLAKELRGVSRRERPDWVHVLAGKVQDRATRHHQLHALGPFEDRHKGGRRRLQMLDVVDDQQ